MTRQTAFPGILVESIEASAGGGGRMLEFEEGLPEQIPTERIRSFLDSINLFESDMVDSSITYNLLVLSISKSAAKAKARTFVRFKNPFETGLLTTTARPMDFDTDSKTRKAYKVSVKVQK